MPKSMPSIIPGPGPSSPVACPGPARRPTVRTPSQTSLEVYHDLTWKAGFKSLRQGGIYFFRQIQFLSPLVGRKMGTKSNLKTGEIFGKKISSVGNRADCRTDDDDQTLLALPCQRYAAGGQPRARSGPGIRTLAGSSLVGWDPGLARDTVLVN